MLIPLQNCSGSSFFSSIVLTLGNEINFVTATGDIVALFPSRNICLGTIWVELQRFENVEGYPGLPVKEFDEESFDDFTIVYMWPYLEHCFVLLYMEEMDSTVMPTAATASSTKIRPCPGRFPAPMAKNIGPSGTRNSGAVSRDFRNFQEIKAHRRLTRCN